MAHSPRPFVAPTEEEKANIKIGLLLDTSSSMDGLINQAQSQLWKIVNELAKAKCDGVQPTLNIALYEYGNDRLKASEGYIRMVTPLTNDLDQISSDLFALKTNGGSEFCGEVIQTATNQLDWGLDNEDLKLIFIAGNEPFDQGSVSPKLACTNANEKGITINTIFCGDLKEGLRTGWKSGSDMTAGHFMSISHNSKTVYIESPYDDEIEQWNTSLNNTYIPYGKDGAIKSEMQSTEDYNASKYGKQNNVSRIISKNSGFYMNATWDLVDAIEQEDFKLSEVDRETLPEVMKSMTEDEQRSYIASKKAERVSINNKVIELNDKRMKYISDKKKEQGETDENSLDMAMMKAIKEQAKTKQFVFEN